MWLPKVPFVLSLNPTIRMFLCPLCTGSVFTLIPSIRLSIKRQLKSSCWFMLQERVFVIQLAEVQSMRTIPARKQGKAPAVDIYYGYSARSKKVTIHLNQVTAAVTTCVESVAHKNSCKLRSVFVFLLFTCTMFEILDKLIIRWSISWSSLQYYHPKQQLKESMAGQGKNAFDNKW